MKEIAANIKVGDKVRSFDFFGRELTGERAAYVEGVVMAIGPAPQDVCPCSGDHLHIRATRRVFGGKEIAEDVGQMYYQIISIQERLLETGQVILISGE